MNKAILKFCNEVNANPKLKSEITSKMLEYCKNNDTEQSKINMINEIILPVASKLGFNFSAEELIDYEENAKSDLTLEDLEGVSGGFGIKKTVVSLFAALGLSTIVSSGATSFAMGSPGLETNSISISNAQNTSGPPTSNPQNVGVPPTSTAQTVNNNVNTTSVSANQIVNANPEESEEVNKIIESIKKKLDAEKEIKNFDFKVEKEDLHNYNQKDQVLTLIEGFKNESKEIAEKLKQDCDFVSLKKSIDKGDKQILGKIFKQIQVYCINSKLTPRHEVAMRCILDDWARLERLEHSENIVASPYFVNHEAPSVQNGLLWPCNDGFCGKQTNILTNMTRGYKIDRYGRENGAYVCAFNGGQPVSYEQRSLANRENKGLYHKYNLIRDFKELPDVIGELGLQDAVELESKAVGAYKEIEPKLKVAFQLKLNSNGCGFNYTQLNNFANSVMDRAKIKEIVDKFKEKLDNKPIDTDKAEINKVVNEFKEELEQKIGKDKAEIKKIVAKIDKGKAEIANVVNGLKKEYDKQIVEDEGNIKEVVDKAKGLGETLSKYVAIFDSVKEGKSEDVQNRINEVHKSIELGFMNLTDNIKNAQAVAGKIAPAFKQEGGGEQIKLPCSVSLLKTLGFLQDMAS